MASEAARLAVLFAGYSGAHGRYETRGSTDDGKIKGRALTVRSAPGPETWAAHLTGGGAPGLGVVPLRDDDTCAFGAADIDARNVDHADLARMAADLPVVVCRSKSGGAHVYLFCDPPAPADLVRDRLAQWAAALGYGGCEVFPKQSSRAGPEDVGNWINLPYYGGDATTRYAVAPNGKRLSLTEFLDAAERGRVRPEVLEGAATPQPGTEDLFHEGPPCLQHLAATGGFPDGTRNEGLFDVAVYLRKRYPDDWERRVSEYNATMCHPVLDHKEVEVIVRSARKKDYGYRCSQPPIAAHCHRRECLRRRFGVGASAPVADISSVTKYVTGAGDPVLWGMEVGGRRLVVSNDDLYNRDSFNRRCLAEASIIPVHLPPARWLRMLQDLVAGADVVESPPDAGPTYLLWEWVEQFCLQKAQARTLDEVWTGRPYRSGGRTLFRAMDLFAYLDARRVDYGRSKQSVYLALRDHGAESDVYRAGGKLVRLWSLPEPQAPESATPPPPAPEEAF